MFLGRDLSHGFPICVWRGLVHAYMMCLQTHIGQISSYPLYRHENGCNLDDAALVHRTLVYHVLLDVRRRGAQVLHNDENPGSRPLLQKHQL